MRAVTAYLDPRSDPGAALAELVETSLVSSRVRGRGTRLRLLGVVREYAAGRLRDAGPDSQSVAHRAHAAWVAQACELVADAWATDDGAVLRDRLERLVPDAMAALRRTLLPSDVGRDDLVVALRSAAAVGRCLHWVPGPALGEAMLEVAERGAERLAPRDLSDEKRAAVGGVGAGAMVAVEHGAGRAEAGGGSLGGSLLRDLHRTGSWAQIWTMLRVLAELLVDEGASADAAFLLGAAENDPSAPPLMGEDVGRHAALRQRLADELGPAVLRRIQEVAATTPRGQVVRRALRLLP